MRYVGTITLSPCADWEIYYEECCVNGTLSTVVDPFTAGLTVFSRVNTLDAPCNSTPTFSMEPILFACYNVNYNYDQGTTIDPDGDSLVYEFYTPINSSLMDPIVYNIPYDSNDFVISGTPITLDNQTGNINLEMSLYEVGVVGIVVREFRGGNEISSTRRENLVMPGTSTAPGILENDAPELGNIYPNPANDLVFVSFQINEPGSLNLYANDGRLIEQIPLNDVPLGVNTNTQINTTDLASGTYFVGLEVDGVRYAARELLVLH